MSELSRTEEKDGLAEGLFDLLKPVVLQIDQSVVSVRLIINVMVCIGNYKFNSLYLLINKYINLLL